MLEGIPAGLPNGIGVVAVVLFVGVLLFRGTLVTRREADAKDRQIEALTAANAEKDHTISDFKDAIATSNSLIKAVLDVAREQTGRAP